MNSNGVFSKFENYNGMNQKLKAAVWMRQLKVDLTEMRMYLSQSTCVEVDWSGIKLNFIPFHSNTCGLKWTHMHPNKDVHVFVSIHMC